MDIDLLQYKPVIDNIMAKLKVRKNDREDITQECYLALIQKQEHLEHGIRIGNDKNYVATICRSAILDLRRSETQHKPGRDEKPEVHFDSLSDPRVYRKAAKVSIPKKPDPEATTSELEEAMLSLPFDEYRVIYELFVEGKTQEQAAKDLGVSERTVRTRNQRGIQLMKEYFEVGE